ncbi:protein of unknown function [Methylorubrum extorquens]|uniref:Uncharacterized protein n=1 Tax=Methylorubrum extorquens TaxID=408 RepID=A0A2N9AWV1_METEX|nr:protein of unknown function [Methylorubrum extorquens]
MKARSKQAVCQSFSINVRKFFFRNSVQQNLTKGIVLVV